MGQPLRELSAGREALESGVLYQPGEIQTSSQRARFMATLFGTIITVDPSQISSPRETNPLLVPFIGSGVMDVCCVKESDFFIGVE